MSVIKNKAKLVERAKDHKAADHVLKGTYLSFLGQDEDITFKACAIGCLATGCTIEEIIQDYGPEAVTEYGGRLYSNVESYDMIKKLEENFGVCESLALLGEAIFEGLNLDDSWKDDEGWVEYNELLSGEDYYGWPLRFAEAIPEGIDITDEMVEEFVMNNDIDIRDWRLHTGDDDLVIDWLHSFVNDKEDVPA